jgi:hypothetical protein
MKKAYIGIIAIIFILLVGAVIGLRGVKKENGNGVAGTGTTQPENGSFQPGKKGTEELSQPEDLIRQINAAAVDINNLSDSAEELDSAPTL